MPQELTNRAERMRVLLDKVFAPSFLEIEDQSHLHHGHAGASPGGETHYAVRIRSSLLSPLSRVARHRAINETLAGEFAQGLHALALDAG
jgi:BolA protein